MFGTFNKRAFISLMTLFLSIFVLITGFLLYILPHSDEVSVLGLNPHGWGFFHMVISFYFVVIVIFHIIQNLKTMLSYMRNKNQEPFKYKKELISALVISLILTIGSVTKSPISEVIDIFEPISEYFWDMPKHEREH